MSLEVFDVEEDCSCACISVRKRCVFDIISSTYARFLLARDYVGSVFGCLGACLRRFWSILGRLVGPLEVSSEVFSELRGCLRGDIAFGVGFLMLCECLGDRFSVNFLLNTSQN